METVLEESADLNIHQSSLSSKLSAQCTTATNSIHGLRTIFNISVVIYHTLLFVSLALDDLADDKHLISGSLTAHILSCVATLGNTAVDTFLLISGFFLKRTFSSMRVTPFTALRYIMFRYLRLAPAYLLIAFVLRYFGNSNCIKPREFFLVHLTKLQNLCIFFGWSTNLDFASHILLLPLLHSSKILALIIILTPPLKLWTWYQRGTPMHPMPPTVQSFCTSEEQYNYWSNLTGIPRGNFDSSHPDLVSRRTSWFAYEPLYFWLIYRIAAVVVGIFLYSSMHEKNSLYRTVRRFPAPSLFCVITVYCFFHIVEYKLVTHHLMRTVHNSAGRLLFTLATSTVIMLTCTIDDCPSQHRISRFMRTVLSCRLFTFLHRFTYVVYLLHIGTLPVLGKFPPRVTKERVVPLWVLLMGIKWYLLTTILGIPIWGMEWMALKARKWLLMKLFVTEPDETDLKDKKNV